MNKCEKEDIKYISRWAINNNFKGKKFLISGATGMIGSFLLKVLSAISENNKIYLVSSNLDRLKQNYGSFEYNLYSYEDIEKINIDIDYVVCLASPTDSSYLAYNPVETIDVIYNLSKKMFEFGLKHHSKILYVSSMEVYGEIFDNHKKKEEELGALSLKSTRNSYPETKRLVELLAYSFYKEYKVDIYIARLSQCFGAGTSLEDKRIFGYIARCVKNLENIILNTRGDSYSNFCYLGDAILAFFYILLKGVSGETYNIVNEDTYMTIYEMSTLISKKLTNGKVKVLINDCGSGVYPKPTKLRMSSEKLRGFGWKPRYDLVDMYIRMISN